MATLSKGYDLEYIWKQGDRGPAKYAASYYIQASEACGEPPDRWWGAGAGSASSPDRPLTTIPMTCSSASARRPMARR